MTNHLCGGYGVVDMCEGVVDMCEGVVDMCEGVVCIICVYVA